jgi:hypothetical protein
MKKVGCRVVIDLTWDMIQCCCEHGNKPSSIKEREFIG